MVILPPPIDEMQALVADLQRGATKLAARSSATVTPPPPEWAVGQHFVPAARYSSPVSAALRGTPTSVARPSLVVAEVDAHLRDAKEAVEALHSLLMQV